jgi:hypothetical protein
MRSAIPNPTLARIPQFWIGIGLTLLGALDYLAPAIIDVLTEGETIPARLTSLPVVSVGACGGICLITFGFALIALAFERFLNEHSAAGSSVQS